MLRVESKDLHAEFASMAPNSPLPWTMKPVPAANMIFIVDANDRAVLQVRHTLYADACGIAGMILTAVNTCGGFKAELS